LALWCAIALPTPALAVVYTVTDLTPGVENMTPRVDSGASGINAKGHVLVYFARYDGSGTTSSFYSNGSLFDLGSLPGANLTLANDINDNGDIVGESGGTSRHAFLYKNKAMIDLGAILDLKDYSRATGINNAGQILGTYGTSFPPLHSFMYDGSKFIDVGASTDLSTQVGSINAAGDFVGSYMSVNANGFTETHGFLSSNGTRIDLNAIIDPGSTDHVEVGRVGPNGEVVGCRNGSAFVYSDGMVKHLGNVGGHAPRSGGETFCAVAINNAGQVVGRDSLFIGRTFLNHGAWLYSGGTMREFTAKGATSFVAASQVLIDSTTWHIVEVAGINDLGEIAATGCDSVRCHALLLSPMKTVVVEYQNTQDFPGSPGGHFFYTEDVSEAAFVDGGGAGHFVRTGRTFNAGGSKELCRFYGSVVPGPNSHFYTASDTECATLHAAQKVPTPAAVPQWNYEGLSFTVVPAATGGAGPMCPERTLPVWRAYNNAYLASGAKNPWDSAHRYTTNRGDIMQMVAQFGWVDEGIVFCAAQ